MSQIDLEIPILIAGGGPVGVVMAMDLAWRGVKSVVLEQRRNIPPNPRCNTTNSRTMEILRRLGCAEAARDAGLPDDHRNDVAYMTRMNGHELARYEWRTRNEMRAGVEYGIGAGWPTPEPILHISQLYLEPVLRQHATGQYGVDLREGFEVVSFVQDDTGVTTLARDVETGRELSIRSRYLVGADGAGSMVRRQIGARLAGIPSIQSTVTTFVRAPRMGQINAQHPTWMYRLLGDGAGGVIVAIDGHDLWLMHQPLRPGQDPGAVDAEPALFAAVGEAFPYEVLNQVRWTARAMVASKFRENRAFLAGDAAHIWIPMGGFGMNAGIADGVSLSWMLAGVLAGWLHPDILDAYEQERAPLGSLVATQAVGIARDIRERNPYDPLLHEDNAAGTAARALRGAQITAGNEAEFNSAGMQLGYAYKDSPIICADGTAPPPFALDTYTETSWPGARAPHFWREGSGASLFDQLGPGFTLLRIGAAPLGGAALLHAAQARGVPMQALDLPEAEAVAKYQGYGLVLVRPDQHIAWRGRSEPENAMAILDRITGAQMPRHVVALYQAEPIAEASAQNDAPGAMPKHDVISPDGTYRFVIDPASFHILQRRVRPDGSLGEPRPFVAHAAPLAGLAIDAAGGIWACCAAEQAVLRFDPAGRLTARVSLGGATPIACALGGAEQEFLTIHCAERRLRAIITPPSGAQKTLLDQSAAPQQHSLAAV